MSGHKYQAQSIKIKRLGRRYWVVVLKLIASGLHNKVVIMGFQKPKWERKQVSANLDVTYTNEFRFLKILLDLQCTAFSAWITNNFSNILSVTEMYLGRAKLSLNSTQLNLRMRQLYFQFQTSHPPGQWATHSPVEVVR